MYKTLKQPKIIFFFFHIFVSSVVYAQKDRIITQAGQEIRCKIIEETPIRFSYYYLNTSGEVAKNQIFKSLVTQFDYNFYPENISKDKVFKETKKDTETVSRFATTTPPQTNSNEATLQKAVTSNKIDKKDESTAPITRSTKVSDYYFSGTTFGIRGGLTNYMASSQPVPPNSELFYDRLYRAYHASADLIYYFGKTVGIGLKAKQLRSNSEGDGISFYNGLLEQESTGFTQMNQIVTMVSPTLSLRYVLDPKTFIYMNGSAGMFQLSQSGKFLTDDFTSKGMNIGFSGALGFDFLLGKSMKKTGLALNIEAGYSSNNQPLLDYGQGAKTLPNPLDLSHLSLSIGLKWMKNPVAKKRTS